MDFGQSGVIAIMLSCIKKTVISNVRNWSLNISLPYIAILLTAIISFFLITEYSWKGIDGKGYSGIINSDGKGYYMYLPNIFLNKSISEQTPDSRYIYEVSKRGVNKYPVGTAVAMVPFFGLGYTIAYFQGDNLDGYSHPFHKAISLAGLFYLLLGLIFLRLLLLQYAIKNTIIALVLILIVFGTNLLTYSVTSPSMSHIYSWCFITSFLYFIKKLINTQQTKYLYLGVLAFSLIVLIRPLNGLILLIIPFLAGSFLNFRKTFTLISSIRSITISCFILSGIWFLQIYIWFIQSGDFFVWTYKDEGFYFTTPQIWNVLFSFRKGLFVYTPLLFLSLFGLLILGKKSKFQLFSITFFFLILVYFISCWWNWYYGPSFGQRPFVEFYGIAGLLLAIMFNHFRSRRYKVLLAVFCFLLVGLNLIQNYQYHFNIISSWDMDFEKYKYVFLKTSPKYRGCLGGNNDILPYNNNRKLVFNIFNDFEKVYKNTSTDQYKFDSIRNTNVCDYRNREFNMKVEIPIDSSFLTQRGLFAEVRLDRFEFIPNSCSIALFVIDISNSQNQNYHYYRFPINETPSDDTESWKTLEYSIELPRIRSVNDVMKIYIWNRKKQAFYIDNLNIDIFSIN